MDMYDICMHTYMSYTCPFTQNTQYESFPSTDYAIHAYKLLAGVCIYAHVW
jgi:hypothetical protein